MISVDSILSDLHDLSKLEDLCRLCGKTQPTIVPIFDETHRYNYYKIILQHFKDEIQVSKADILPLKMCSKCLKSMMSWHEFYLDCLKVEKKFKRLMDKFSLNHDSNKPTSTVGNDVEVIEVSVDCDNLDFYNETTNVFDISNINIKESSSLANTDDFTDFHDVEDINDSDAENKTSDNSLNHSESKTPKIEDPKKKDTNKSQLALGKRSTASKVDNDESCSYPAKRTRSSVKAGIVSGGGGGSGGITSKQSIPSIKPKSVGKSKKSTIVKTSPAKPVVKLEKTNSPNVSIKPPAPAADPSEAFEIFLKEDNDTELYETEFKLEQTDWKNEDDDGDEIVNQECDIESDSPSPESNGTKNPDDTGTSKEKKKFIRPPKMCDVCGKVVSAKLFKEHMVMHNDPESMTCSCCGKLFSTVSTLKKHFIWTHTSLRPFMCDLCGSTFKRNDHLKLHREHFHANENSGGTAVKCGVCGASVQTMVSLQSHMKRVHNQKKILSYDKDLNHKILADKSYECGICGLNFKQFSYLRIHIKFVHEKGLPWHINQGASGPYKCEPCNTTYATLQSLREHNRRRHDGAPVEKFHKECTHCGMLYRNRLHYSKHLAKISGRPTCYVCWNDFDTADDLKVHINSDHLDELPFGCELCGVRFVYLTELRNHMYTHSKTKQFKCDQCNQSFVRKDFLKSHKRRHQGIRNHTCEECSKSFVEFCDLRKHMQIHMKNKMFTAKEEKSIPPSRVTSNIETTIV